MDYNSKIEKARNLQHLFEIAKGFVQEYLDMDQAGLLIGLSDLGIHQNGFVGAFYAPNANMIVVNKKPLTRIKQTKPQLYNYYLFHVLLHEYIHALGFYDELQTRQIVHALSKEEFGDGHVLTQLAQDLGKILPYIQYPNLDYSGPQDMSVEFIFGIDRRNTNYIQ